MKKILFSLLFLSVWQFATAQNPQTQTAPIYAVNAKYNNGVGTGYWPTPGTGLVLNVSAGTSFCSGTIQTYAGGTLTMTASTTNYVYLNTASSCAPAVKTTAFTTSDMPLAVVVTGLSTITSITDDRTTFSYGLASSSIVASPQFQIPYYDLAGTQNSIKGDPKATTDGAGNYTLNSTNDFQSLTSPSTLHGGFPRATNSGYLLNFNMSTDTNSFYTGSYEDVELAATASGTSPGLIGNYSQVYDNGPVNFAAAHDGLVGYECDIENNSTGRMDANLCVGGSMLNVAGGTISSGQVGGIGGSEDDGLQGFHNEYTNGGTVSYISDLTSLSHVNLQTGSTTTAVSGLTIFGNVILGSGVTLPSLYGIYINDLQGKATNVYAIYSHGTEPSFFGGPLTASALTITGCAAGTYAKADGTGCGTPSGGGGGGGLCPSVNSQTGTTYTLVLTDGTTSGAACIGTLTMNNAVSNTITVPSNASVAFFVPDEIDITQLGAGQTTLAGANLATGTVNTSTTTVTWVSGTTFDTTGAWNGLTIAINSVNYVISSVASSTSLTLTTSAGTQTGVADVLNVNLITPTSLSARAQNSTIFIKQLQKNLWLVGGDTL